MIIRLESCFDSRSFSNARSALTRASTVECTGKNETTLSRYSSGALFRRCTMLSEGRPVREKPRADPISGVCVLRKLGGGVYLLRARNEYRERKIKKKRGKRLQQCREVNTKCDL